MKLKDSILQALEENRESAISGQALASRFGVSRNAVWKAVNALREEGIAIESTQNRGHKLSPAYDRVTVSGLQALMGTQGVAVHCLALVDSTNNQAKRLMVAGEAAPFLVVAEQQTAGRGRQGRTFYSPPQAGLYMTLALGIGQLAEDALGVTAFAAVAVAEAVYAVCGVKTSIKWVNDLFYQGKKVCGILTEATTDLETGTMESLLIGIGLNLRESDVPQELRDVVGHLGCAGAVKNRLAAEITARLLAYQPLSTAHLAAYRAHSLTLGQRVVCQSGGVSIEGLAEDIDTNGALLVRDATGLLHTVRSGEVRPAP